VFAKALTEAVGPGGFTVNMTEFQWQACRVLDWLGLCALGKTDEFRLTQGSFVNFENGGVSQVRYEWNVAHGGNSNMGAKLKYILKDEKDEELVKSYF